MTVGDAQKIYDETIRAFRSAGASLRCSDAKKHLEDLGFVIRDGKKGGHKLFGHNGIPGFYGGDYNCGHGKNPEIKPAYIRKILTVLDEYEEQIKEYLRRTQKV
mgnify:CR=1 FL=1